MATLIQQDFDMFTTLGPNVHIPHSFADLCRNLAHQERDVKNSGTPSNHIGFKVPMIRFLRASFKDNDHNTLGLKDAKDIVDHYYATCDQRRVGI